MNKRQRRGKAFYRRQTAGMSRDQVMASPFWPHRNEMPYWAWLKFTELPHYGPRTHPAVQAHLRAREGAPKP